MLSLPDRAMKIKGNLVSITGDVLYGSKVRVFYVTKSRCSNDQQRSSISDDRSSNHLLRSNEHTKFRGLVCLHTKRLMLTTGMISHSLNSMRKRIEPETMFLPSCNAIRCANLPASDEVRAYVTRSLCVQLHIQGKCKFQNE
jgi:hypothetical protein